LSACERKLLSAESQVNELQARLNDAVNQRRHWEDEYNVSSSPYSLLLVHRLYRVHYKMHTVTSCAHMERVSGFELVWTGGSSPGGSRV